MKLRNKKTGRIVNFRHIAIDEPKDDRENYRYSSLAEFNDEWEDVTEPLIKDEKIRKAVRAWAEANGLNAQPIYFSAKYNRFCDAPDFSIAIDFYREVKGGPHDEYSYYLGELCGEEEE